MDSDTVATTAVVVIGLASLIGALICGLIDYVADRAAPKEKGQVQAREVESSPGHALRPLIFVCPACHLIEGRAAHVCRHPGAAICILEEDRILGSPAGLAHERVRGRRWQFNLYRGIGPDQDQDMALELYDARLSEVHSWQ